MAHVRVRLPLIPTEYLLNNVVRHPLIETSPECMFFHKKNNFVLSLVFKTILFVGKCYVKEAIKFNDLKKQQQITILDTIRSTRRSGNLQEVCICFD